MSSDMYTYYNFCLSSKSYNGQKEKVLDLKCVFQSSLPLLFKTFFLWHTFRTPCSGHAETRTHRSSNKVSCHFYPILTKNINASFCLKFTNIFNRNQPMKLVVLYEYKQIQQYPTLRIKTTIISKHNLLIITWEIRHISWKQKHWFLQISDTFLCV